MDSTEVAENEAESDMVELKETNLESLVREVDKIEPITGQTQGKVLGKSSIGILIQKQILALKRFSKNNI